MKKKVLWAFFLSLSASVLAQNMVVNPGIEEGKDNPAGWTPHHFFFREGDIGPGTKAEWATDEARSGQRSLKITVTKSLGRTLDWSSDFIPVKGGVSIKASGWMKTKDVVAGADDHKVPNFLLRCYDKDKKMVRQYWIARNMSKETGWTSYQDILALPENASFAEIRAGLSDCTGTAWFDDFEIVFEEKKTMLETLNLKELLKASGDSTEPVIVPVPWKTEFGEKEMLLDGTVCIVQTEPLSNPFIVEELQEFLKSLGIEHQVTAQPPDLSTTRNVILTGKKNPLIEKYLEMLDIKVDWSELESQGYILAVKKHPKGTIVILSANEEAGIYYALQTLRQYPLKRDNGYFLREGLIVDKPAYPLRTLFAGPGSIGRLKKWVAPLKLNMFFAQLDTSNTWDKPFTEQQKDFAREFLQECQKRFVTPVVGMRPDRGYVRRIQYTGDKDIQLVREKYKDLYECGYRHFYLFLDDGPRHLEYAGDKERFKNIGNAHYYLIETVYKHLKNLDPGNKLHVCLVHYMDPLQWTTEQKEYISIFKKLPADIELINTGSMKNIESVKEHVRLTGRAPFIWDNWVSQFEEIKPVPIIVAPPGIEYPQELHKHVTGYGFVLLDKEMMWFTASNYLWNASRYKPEKDTEKILRKLFGNSPGQAETLLEYQNFFAAYSNLPVKGTTKEERMESIKSLINTFNLIRKKVAENIPELAGEVEATAKNRIALLEKVFVPQLENKPFPIEVPFTDIAPGIDGKIDEPAWAKSARLADFNLLLSRKRDEAEIPQATEVKIIHDRKNLYLAFICSEPSMDKLVKNKKEFDSEVWEDDCIEMMFSPDKTPEKYYHMAVNSTGTLYDAFLHDNKWISSAAVKTSEQDDKWIVEISIPFKSFGTNITAGSKWHFNLFRTRYAGGKPEFSSWAVTERRFHEPERFWMCEFK